MTGATQRRRARDRRASGPAPRAGRSRRAPLLGATLVLVICSGGCRSDEGTSRAPVLFAAASTAHVVEAAVAAFTARTGVPVRTSYAASSTIARQLAAGAPADIVITAAPWWMDQLAEKGVVAPESRATWAMNQLVVVAPRGRGFSLSVDPRTLDASTPGRDPAAADGFPDRLVLGDPAHVPAGVYARQALERLGWWTALADRVVPAADARTAVAYIARGEAPAGIVYASDLATAEGRLERVFDIPASLHDPIVYEVAATRASRNPAGDRLRAFLLSEETRAVLAAAGFTARRGAHR